MLDFTQGVLPLGATFTRATVANDYTASAVTPVGINVPRLNYGSLLYEPFATKNWLFPSRDVSGWTKRGTATMTVDGAMARPDGTLGAQLITVSGAGTNDMFFLTTGHASGKQVTESFFIKKVTSSGMVPFKNPSGGGGQFTIDLSLLGSGWEEMTALHPAVTINAATWAAFSDGRAGQWFNGPGTPVSFYYDNGQEEEGGVASSPVTTTSAADTRGAELLQIAVPPGCTQVLVTFDDNSTETLAVTAGTFNVPALYRPRIKNIEGTVYLPFVYDAPTQLTDSIPLVAMGSGQTSRLRGSAFARAIYDTTATSVSVDVWNDLSIFAKSFQQIGIVVNGSYYATLQSPGADNTAPGKETLTTSLPAGSKRVEIIAGIQSFPATGLIGMYIRGITFNAAATRYNPPPATKRVTIYGNSIVVGQAANPAVRDCWAMKLRAGYANSSVMVVAWGYRALSDDTSTTAARAQLVADLTGNDPTDIIIEPMVNDYALNTGTQSAANYGTRLAALVDDLHTAKPSAKIWLQSALVRGTESANQFGNTLGDYRTAMQTVQSTRTGFANYIDGSTILTLGDLSPDLVHPSEAGHAIEGAFWLATLP